MYCQDYRHFSSYHILMHAAWIIQDQCEWHYKYLLEQLVIEFLDDDYDIRLSKWKFDPETEWHTKHGARFDVAWEKIWPLKKTFSPLDHLVCDLQMYVVVHWAGGDGTEARDIDKALLKPLQRVTDPLGRTLRTNFAKECKRKVKYIRYITEKYGVDELIPRSFYDTGTG